MYSILFDCDGVLVDSEKWSCGAWLPVLARRGIHAQLADIEAFIGQSDTAVLNHFSQQTGLDLSGDLVAEKETEYFDLARGRLETFAGIETALRTLMHCGASLAVASSGRPHKISFSLGEVGLLSYFPIICSAVEVQLGKPAPDLFLFTAERLGITPDHCIVVEDSVFGIQAARAAGMHTLGFSSSHSEEKLLAAGAHRVFSHYDQLILLLKERSSTFF
jgi:HAD superfamily hydrolase (TIGR01509 family)